jgi:hypothetical protein
MAKLNPALACKVLRNRAAGTWDVIGPSNHYHAYHNQLLAEAVAAFLSGDEDEAKRHRKAWLIQIGLLPAE